MILKRIILHNYRQHKDLDRELSGNVIGVIGENGSGKSNLLGALHFLFAGEQPGVKKADLLSWGAAEGHAEVYFEHDGKEGKLFRSINTNGATLSYDGDTYNGITRVNEMMEKRFGMDKDLLKQAIFVRQAEVDAILFTDPRIREMAFQKLCGIGDAAKIHKKLGDVIGSMSTPPNYDDQIAEGLKRQAEMQVRAQELQGTLARVQEARAKAPTIANIQAALDAYRDLRMRCVRAQTIKADLTAYVEREAVISKKLSDVHGQDFDIVACDKQIDNLKQLLRMSAEYRRLYKEYEEAGTALLQLGDVPVPETVPYTQEQLDALQKSAEALVSEYNTAMSNLKIYTELAAVVNKCATAECPVCGSPIKDTTRLSKLIIKYNAQMEANNPKWAKEKHIDAANAVYCIQDKNLKSKERYKTQKEAFTARYARAEQMFTAVSKVEMPDAEIVSGVTQLQEQRKAALDASTLATKLSSDLRNCTEYKNKLNSELSGLMDIIEQDKNFSIEDMDGNIKTLDKRIDVLQPQIVEIQKLDMEIAQLSGMTGELHRNMEQLNQTVETLKKKRDQQSTLKQVVDTLTAVRDWFHYANGPHTLTTAVLQDMTNDINRFLGYFTAPFTVTPSTELLGFNVIFHDGRQVPADPPDASVLSGGQKIQLALSFRMASYCVFAERQGIMTIDEPTAYLDSQNIGRICTLFERVRDVAKNMNLQILISTHEQAIASFMDTVIDLDVK